MKRKPLILLAVVTVALAPLLFQGISSTARSDTTFDSPVPTPPVPPTPTPLPPSAEAQKALLYVSEREGIPTEGLLIINDYERAFPLIGCAFRAVTILDIRTTEGQAYSVLVDLTNGRIEEDVNGVEAAEEAAYQARYGKFHPSLYERLQKVGDDDLLPVAIWVAGDAKVRTQEEVFAELAAQYPEVAAAIERGRKPFEVDDPALAEEIRREYRRMRAEDTAVRIEPLVDHLGRRGFAVRMYGAMPSVSGILPKKVIEELAERDDVGLIYLIEEQGSVSTDTAAPTDRVPAVWQKGFDGSGTRIAILEAGNIDGNVGCLDIVATRPGQLWLSPPWHKTWVASIAACDDDTYTGVAHGAQIVDAGFDETGWPGGASQEDAVEALRWAIQDEDANAVNLSYKWEIDNNLNWTDRAFDYWARAEWVVIAKTSDNNDDGSGRIGSPGKAWNVITVGGSDDKQTSTWSDDEIWGNSSYINPVGVHREKPEGVAPAVSITAIGPGNVSRTGTGTSAAAPQVAGLAALLIDRKSDLELWPEAIKAIIMASAVHNVHGSSDIPTGQELRDGAGSIDAALADEIAKLRWTSSTTPCDAPCWWGVPTYSYDPSVGSSLYRYFNASKGERIRVAIAWWSNADPPLDHPGLARDELDVNYDLYVYDPNGTLVGYTASRDNNYELAEFTASETGKYKIRVYRSPEGDNNESSNYLGIAWVKTATYLPDVKSSYNGWDSDIIIRNDGAESKDVTVTLFYANGDWAGGMTYSSLPSGAVWVYNPSHTGFTGSAIVAASEDVSVVVETHHSDGRAYSYNGVAADLPNLGWGQVGTTIHLPLLMDNNSGWSTSVTILNTGSDTATFDFDYYGQNSGGPYQGPQGSLGPQASATYGQLGTNCPTNGAGRITGDRPLAVIVSQSHSSGINAAYNGFSGDGVTTVNLPLVMANNYGWLTGIAVQNLGSAPANITVNYYPEHGSQYPNRNPETVYNVQPNATAIVVQSGGQWGSARWVGSARVIASASQPIAAIVNQAATGKASSYNGFAPASRLVVLPVVRNDYGGWSSGVQVQNLDSATANVVVRVNGNQTWSGSIGAYRSVTLYPVPGTGSGFQGPVTVECTNGKPIAAIVNTVASGTGDLTMTYNGVNR